MPFIHIKNRSLEYEFSFTTKFLILTGDSGDGKTTLVDMIRDYAEEPDSVENMGDKNLVRLTSEGQLLESGNVYFMDEFDSILWSSNISQLLNNSNNYFVIATRKRDITQIKLPLEALVEMTTSEDGRYHSIRQRFPSKKHLEDVGDYVICEDSKSGFEFVRNVLGDCVEHANGNTRFPEKIRKLRCSNCTIVFDRAGIGYLYEQLLLYAEAHGIKIVSEIDWDSFESYILEAPIYNIKVPDFPDKEANATRLVKTYLCKDYDKSKIPEGLEIPVYWKVREALNILNERNKSCDGPTKSNIF